jgi:hypothetical protein
MARSRSRARGPAPRRSIDANAPVIRATISGTPTSLRTAPAACARLSNVPITRPSSFFRSPITCVRSTPVLAAHPEVQTTIELTRADTEFVSVRRTTLRIEQGREVVSSGGTLFRIAAGKLVEQWSW